MQNEQPEETEQNDSNPYGNPYDIGQLDPRILDAQGD